MGVKLIRIILFVSTNVFIFILLALFFFTEYDYRIMKAMWPFEKLANGNWTKELFERRDYEKTFYQ